MPFIGNPIYQSAFVTDTFSGNGTTTAFTMSVAPAGTTNVLVAISGVLQDPSTYGVVGTTITFSTAPPTGTGNISCRYLGIPVTGVTTTAYRTVTEFTATAGQTTFTPPSYTVGFINVYRNGVLLGSADYTATNGTTVVLTTGATSGDLVTVESFLVSSVLNAIPNTAGAVSTANLVDGSVTTAKLATQTRIPMTYGSLGSGNASIMKNRIINGAMVIDQRNAGAAVTVDGASSYITDRFFVQDFSDAVLSAQQVSDAPAGFINSLKVTVSTADSSLSATQGDRIGQRIEGLNIYDLAWGTASAQTITLSFWVKSSLTGTFSGSLQNSAANRAYPFTYSISSANTWEQKSVTIVGDTTGTWLTTNGVGILVNWSLGMGSTYSGTAGAWAASDLIAATGAVSVVGTLNATFQITGVQLEVGSSATGFEYRQYQQELALCQRYAYKRLADGSVNNYAPFGIGRYVGTNNAQLFVPFPVTMRTSPGSVTVSGNFAINDTTFSPYAWTSIAFNETSCDGATVTGTTTSGTTAGYATTMYADNANVASLLFSAEL